MKIRANLNFFLSRRRTNLKGLCERNNIKTREELLGFLDDISVKHPSEEDLKSLFSKPKKVQKKEVRTVTKKDTPTPAPKKSTSRKAVRRAPKRGSGRSGSPSASEK